VEFVSTMLQEAGYDGLPVYREPWWSPVSSPEIAQRFPLVLSSGARRAAYTHSQGRQLRILRQREPEPRIELNPEDAADRDIRDGDEVLISSPLGKVIMIASVGDTVPPGVVSAPHGWADADINRLIPDAGLDPISGFPPFRSSLCQVERHPPPGRGAAPSCSSFNP
jgi:anaerobic selenocysteine-containing dehydrogenase